jgi:hypothetical protein
MQFRNSPIGDECICFSGMEFEDGYFSLLTSSALDSRPQEKMGELCCFSKSLDMYMRRRDLRLPSVSCSSLLPLTLLIHIPILYSNSPVMRSGGWKLHSATLWQCIKESRTSSLGIDSARQCRLSSLSFVHLIYECIRNFRAHPHSIPRWETRTLTTTSARLD